MNGGKWMGRESAYCAGKMSRWIKKEKEAKEKAELIFHTKKAQKQFVDGWKDRFCWGIRCAEMMIAASVKEQKK